jgi:DNA-binding ferritin-like protein
MDHVTLVSERTEEDSEAARASRAIAGKHADADTVHLLTHVIAELEKRASSSRASLAG